MRLSSYDLIHPDGPQHGPQRTDQQLCGSRRPDDAQEGLGRQPGDDEPAMFSFLNKKPFVRNSPWVMSKARLACLVHASLPLTPIGRSKVVFLIL